MKYCKNCGVKLDDNDKFCAQCGTKTASVSAKNKSTKKEPVSDLPGSPSDKHGVPAILSAFFPTVGQFVKGQVKWGLTIWLWFVLGNLFVWALSGIFRGFTIILFVVFNLFWWVHQIYDAYSAPEIEPKEN